ncbi:MAG: hypothetical protein U5R06_03590 [candidate division KSB1 bacterium]|nr:hypothetical protein [candidate division KSB1 bacterium]
MQEYYRIPHGYELPVVNAGDIIIIPEQGESLWRNIVSVVRDISGFASLFTMAYYIIRIQNESN